MMYSAFAKNKIIKDVPITNERKLSYLLALITLFGEILARRKFGAIGAVSL